jgi:hypothetical protein
VPASTSGERARFSMRFYNTNAPLRTDKQRQRPGSSARKLDVRKLPTRRLTHVQPVRSARGTRLDSRGVRLPEPRQSRSRQSSQALCAGRKLDPGYWPRGGNLRAPAHIGVAPTSRSPIGWSARPHHRPPHPHRHPHPHPQLPTPLPLPSSTHQPPAPTPTPPSTQPLRQRRRP